VGFGPGVSSDPSEKLNDVILTVAIAIAALITMLVVGIFTHGIPWLFRAVVLRWPLSLKGRRKP